MTNPELLKDKLFLVAGCGSIGQRHIGNLQRLGITKILAVEPRDEQRSAIASRYAIDAVADLETALDKHPFAALVCTPSKLHLGQALAAAQAGCHLFVEKPLAETMEGVDKLIYAVDGRELLSLVGCNFRFHPGLRKVKQLLEDGCIGRVISARADFGQYLPDWHPWEDYRKGYSANRSMGGGVLLDRIHEIDYMRWLLGEADEVSAIVGHFSGLEIDTNDVAEMMIRFRSSAIGSLHMDYVRRSYRCSLDITGELGSIEWSFDGHIVRWYLAEDRCWRSQSWKQYDPNQMYLEEMEHFLSVLRGEEPSLQSIAEGAVAVKIAAAAEQSSIEQRAIWL